jgi:hypothetical protein
MACNGISNAAEFFKPDGDPPYPDNEEVVKSFLEQFGNRLQTIGIGSLPATLGGLLYIDERKRSLTDELKFGPEVVSDIKAKFQTEFKVYERQRRFTHACFICETEILENGTTCFNISPTDYLIDFLYALNANDEGNSDHITYTIFLESMRQQICQGVGLRCPFWDGECCGSDIRALLATVYSKTKPWMWQHHWQPPPCLL